MGEAVNMDLDGVVKVGIPQKFQHKIKITKGSTHMHARYLSKLRYRPVENNGVICLE